MSSAAFVAGVVADLTFGMGVFMAAERLVTLLVAASVLDVVAVDF